MNALAGHLAEHANPHRRALASDPLAQLEEIHAMCVRAGHTSRNVVEAVADALTELMLTRGVRAIEDDPLLRMTCSICGQRARYGERWEAGAEAHALCLAALPSEAELISDDWER